MTRNEREGFLDAFRMTAVPAESGEPVRLLPHHRDQPVNLLIFSDGREVVCTHDGAPCNGCQTPREQWPKCWEPGFLTLEE